MIGTSSFGVTFIVGRVKAWPSAPLGPAERFELLALRYVEAIALELVEKMSRQFGMAAQRDVIFFLRFADEADVERPMNFGAGKHTKWRHVRFGENLGLVVADDQEDIGLGRLRSAA